MKTKDGVSFVVCLRGRKTKLGALGAEENDKEGRNLETPLLSDKLHPLTHHGQYWFLQTSVQTEIWGIYSIFYSIQTTPETIPPFHKEQKRKRTFRGFASDQAENLSQHA